jgi:hypothetical protein
MKITHVLIAACIGAGALAAPAQRPPAPVFSPAVWGVHISTSSNNLRTDQVVASLTTARATEISRIEVEVAWGPLEYVFDPFPGQQTACTRNPTISVTEGTTVFTLPLNSPLLVATGSAVVPDGSSTDSGPISVVFPADSRIKVLLVPGDLDDYPSHSRCDFSDANITIQYR